MSEPHATAVFLFSVGALLCIATVLSRASGRIGLPVALGFLGVGMVAGSEGPFGIDFEDYGLAMRVGTTALALILFDGGLHTPLPAFKAAFRPAAVLATAGVAGTALAGSLGARAIGFGWHDALLFGAVVSSTDAAAVFSVLKTSGVQLRHGVGLVLELESGLNDPMAVLLTIALARGLTWSEGLVKGALELAVGAAAGIAIGFAARALLPRVKLAAAGLYPVLTVSIALIAFSAPTLLHGSGFLAVYLAAVLLGDARLPYQSGLLRVHDALAWLAQVGMFLLLGLLVFPSRLAAVALHGLGLALFLAIVARPLVVLLCLLPFRLPVRHIASVGWIGLRGAVPIILATFPVLEGVPRGREIFDLVFFVVVVNAVVPGWTVPWVAKRLGVGTDAKPAPPALLEIQASRPLRSELLSFLIEPASAVAGSRIADLPFPEDASILLVIRGDDPIAARGATVLQAGDHVYLFCKPEDRPLLDLLFGREEER